PGSGRPPGSGRTPGRAEPRLIHRHDLLAALNRAARKRVTIIAAPAGTGKTSLLRAWAAQPGQDGRIAFVTVRPGQHDMQLFWLTMLGAIRTAAGTGEAGAELPPAAPGSGGSALVERVLAEMLERQPPEVQDLLLRTSVLDRVNGELADLLTGATGSERILLDLEDANAFVVSLDPGRTWFRYHRMFGGLLRLELRRTIPADIAGLHQLAARWLAERGQAADAIGHLQAAGDWDEAGRPLTAHAPR